MQAEYLRSSISSLQTQTLPSWEAIIVNDGSMDNTTEVATEICQQDSRVTLISKPNGGLSSARNAGIEAAQGKFLLFLDADDSLSQTALALLVQKISTSACDLVFGGYLRFRTNPHIDWFAPASPRFSIAPLRSLLQENPFPVHAALVRKSIAKQLGGFDQGLKSCEDWDYWLRACLDGAHIQIIPDIVAHYRTLDNSMSTNHERMLKNRVKVFLKTTQALETSQNVSKEIGQDLYTISTRLRRRLHAIPPDESTLKLIAQLRDIQHRFASFGNQNTKSKLKVFLDKSFPKAYDSLYPSLLRICWKKELQKLANDYH